jgi:ATP-dependent protease ClpP protease subunit
MYPTSQMMIHNCWTYASGNANDFRKIADQMDAIMESSRTAYLDKADGKLSAEKLQEMLDAETYLPAEKCLEYGLCDEVIGKEPADPADPKPNEYKEPPKDPNFIAPTAKVKPWFF